MYMLICINRNTGTSNAIILLCRVIFFVYTVLVMNNLNQEISFLGTQFASVFGSISKKFLYAFCLFFFFLRNHKIIFIPIVMFILWNKSTKQDKKATHLGTTFSRSEEI